MAHIVVHHILAKTGDVAMVRSFCTLVSFNESELPPIKWFNIRGEQLKLRAQMLMKPVYNVNTQQRFQSITEAATSIPGKNVQTVAGCIHNAVNGKRRAYGYFWLLEESKDPNVDLATYLQIYTQQMKQRRQKADMCNAKTIINVDTQQVYNSVAEAAKAHNVKRHTLADACRRHYRCAGYYWQYVS